MKKVKEISILTPVNTDNITSKTDRQLEFDRLSENSDIPKHHFNTFYELENEIINEKKVQTNILTVIIKNYIDNLGLLSKKATSKKYSISVQLNKPVYVKNEDTEETMIYPSNSFIKASGVIFNNMNNYFNDIKTPHLLENLSLRDKLLSGITGVYSVLKTSQYDIKNNKIKYLIDETELKSKPKEVKISINDEKNGFEILNLIKSYVDYTNSFNEKNYYLLYNKLQQYSLAETYVSKSSITEKKSDIKSTLLVDNIDKIYTNKLLIDNDTTTMLYDIKSGNLSEIYYLSKLFGYDHDKVVDAINKEKARQLSNKNKYIHKLNENILKTIKFQKLSISRDLFNKNDLKELTKKELDVVNNTYEKEKKFNNFISNKKFKYTKFLNNVLSSKTRGTKFNKEDWIELKKLIIYNKDNKDEFIKSSESKLPILCPHNYDYFEHMLNTEGIRNNLVNVDNKLTSMLLKNYSDRSSINNSHYCKICGEKIVTVFSEKVPTFIKGEKVETIDVVDDLNSKIWKEARNVIKSNIIFKSSTNINEMSSSISSAIQPFIEIEQEKLKMVKTNSFEDIQNTVYLYINIYVYAAIVRILSHNPDDIHFKSLYNKTSNKKVKGGNSMLKVNLKTLQRLLITGLKLLTSTKESLIDKIPNISMTSIKPLFIKAFKQISKLYIKISSTITEVSPFNFIREDVSYSYLCYAKRKHDNKLLCTNTKKIIGVDVQDVKDLKHVLEKIVIPEKWEYGKMKNISQNHKEFLSLYNDYSYKSFRHFIEYARDQLYLIPIQGSKKHSDHVIQYKNILQLEDKINRELYKRFQTPINKIFDSEVQIPSDKKTSLSTIYCKNGDKHKFQTYVYKQDMIRLELSTKNMDDWMFDPDKNKEFMSMEIADYKCSLCSELLSKMRNKNNDKELLDSLNKKNELYSFYNLYTFKCPTKGLHVFSNNKCTKCKVDREDLIKKDEKYYEKHKNEFRKYMETQKQDLKIEKTVDQTYINDYKDWEINTSSIDKIIKLEKLSENVIKNIGFIEANDYKKIESGVLDVTNTNKTKEHLQHKILQLHSYMMALLTEYEMLKNGKIRSIKLQDFQNKWENIDFSKFPNILVDYLEKYRSYSNNRIDSEKFINFILHSIFTFLLTIYNFIHPTYKKSDLSHSLVKYFIKRILNSEKDISDPGVVVFDETKEIDIVEEGDAVEFNYFRDSKVDGESDPFDFDGFDVDKDVLESNYRTVDDK